MTATAHRALAISPSRFDQREPKEMPVFRRLTRVEVRARICRRRPRAGSHKSRRPAVDLEPWHGRPVGRHRLQIELDLAHSPADRGATPFAGEQRR